VFVAVDFPDFNFRLMARLKKLGVPIVYYISPQLWAWRTGRMRTMQRLVSKVLVIFPFEEPLYREAGLPVEFVGHPLIDLIPPTDSPERFLSGLGLDPPGRTFALLPGSRANEVRLILPTLVDAAQLIASRLAGAQFLLARAPRLDPALFAPFEHGVRRGLRGAVVEQRADAVLAAADVVLTASGTATVQAALHGKPMVIVYRLSPLTYRLGIRFVRVDTYGMVNLVAGRRIVPELIQDEFTPEAVARESLRYLEDSDHAARTREALADVVRRLGGPGASRRAAEAVLRLAERGRAPAAGRLPRAGVEWTR
jgi:lipid-A-disaccharide synthase